MMEILYIVAYASDGVECGIGTLAELKALEAQGVFGAPVIFKRVS